VRSDNPGMVVGYFDCCRGKILGSGGRGGEKEKGGKGNDGGGRDGKRWLSDDSQVTVEVGVVTKYMGGLDVVIRGGGLRVHCQAGSPATNKKKKKKKHLGGGTSRVGDSKCFQQRSEPRKNMMMGGERETGRMRE